MTEINPENVPGGVFPKAGIETADDDPRVVAKRGQGRFPVVDWRPGTPSVISTGLGLKPGPFGYRPVCDDRRLVSVRRRSCRYRRRAICAAWAGGVCWPRQRGESWP